MVRKKKQEETYLVCHRSGVVAKTNTLSSQDPINGITAIINLKTLEQFNGEKWEKIPEGYESLIAAEEEESEYEEFEEEEVVSPDALQLGARRYYNPNVIWAYCKSKLTRD
jgi:hypothetical protein